MKSTDWSVQANGSLSVFFAMILPLMFSLCFSMLEVTRICGLDQNSQELTRQMLESTFSEYQPVLWEKYRILALDMAYTQREAGIGRVSERMMELGAWYGEAGEDAWMNHFLALSPKLCDVTSYGLLTDGDGAPLIYQGVKAAKEEIASDIWESWVKDSQETDDLLAGSPSIRDIIEQGKNILAEAKKQFQGSEQSLAEQQSLTQQREPKDSLWRETSVAKDDTFNMQDNPFEVFEEWEQKGMLALVLPSDKEISQGYIDRENAVSQRERKEGSSQDITPVGVADKVLFGEYILRAFSRYASEQQSSGDSRKLWYETEYLIGGEERDGENLESVVSKILLVREVSNLAAIYMDPVKVNQAKQAALSLASFSGNPIVIEAVQAAVIAVWAFVESMLDVRLLLVGGTVPVVKNQMQWTSDLTKLGSYLSLHQKAKESERGMAYSDYLRIFLALMPADTLALRSCDIMEHEMQRQEGYENARMDHMIYKMEAKCSYQAQPVFFRFIWPVGQQEPSYSFTKEGKLSY